MAHDNGLWLTSHHLLIRLNSRYCMTIAFAVDQLAFDSWLLPFEIPSRMEQAVRLISTASGPVIGTITLAFVIAWII